MYLSPRLLLIVNTSFILFKISNISVQVVSAPGKLPGRRPPRKPITRAKPKKYLKKKAPFWNVQNKIILFTVFLFILAVIAWTLLWLYISELKSLVPLVLGLALRVLLAMQVPSAPGVSHRILFSD